MLVCVGQFVLSARVDVPRQDELLLVERARYHRDQRPGCDQADARRRIAVNGGSFTTVRSPTRVAGYTTRSNVSPTHSRTSRSRPRSRRVSRRPDRCAHSDSGRDLCIGCLCHTRTRLASQQSRPRRTRPNWHVRQLGRLERRSPADRFVVEAIFRAIRSHPHVPLCSASVMRSSPLICAVPGLAAWRGCPLGRTSG